jgi:protein TonB
LAVGYALLSGLAYTVIHNGPGRTIVISVPKEPPPPPPRNLDTQRTKQPVNPNPIPQTPDNTLKTEPTIIRTPNFEGPIGTTGGGGGPAVLPIEPIRPSQAADAMPGKDRLRWITTEDYPSGAIRQNIQGLVVISVMIDAEGKVRSCVVTQSSGSKLLDDATCRLYTARAHFTPARDADGNPTTAQRTDRYRWQIPNE